ncbi:MAG: 23S rRNA (pseudouridine(1915)-N(3))-methyltransferase RlmH [bacterium]
MKIEFWSIGKQHDPSIKDAIEEYTSRIKKYAPVKWEIIPVPKNAQALSETEQKRQESKLILDRIEKDMVLVALDEYGKEMSSTELASFLTKKSDQGIKKIVFLIGGAFGIDQTLLEKSDHKWSLSRLTFPHQMVRLILAEQIYRAFSITRNEKYHHQ